VAYDRAVAWAPRRVVTGHDAAGKSIVTSDGPPPVEHVTPDGVARFLEIWRTDAMPVPIPAVEPDPTGGPVEIPPGANGTRVRLVEINPGRCSPMHRTETVDYGIVLEGELYLVLDDSEVRLEPGDVVVQRGTNHAWDNRSDRVARVAFVLVDGRRI
jgi:quercetin dioxygenase-like cupin family protein